MKTKIIILSVLLIVMSAILCSCGFLSSFNSGDNGGNNSGNNDTPEEIRDIASFAKTLTGVTEIHLLPYHRLGADKYAGLGREYELKDILPPTDEHMEMLKGVAESVGLKCQIGG